MDARAGTALACHLDARPDQAASPFGGLLSD
jgi:hypothetical protein